MRKLFFLLVALFSIALISCNSQRNASNVNVGKCKCPKP